jgi:hypothetical protein
MKKLDKIVRDFCEYFFFFLDSKRDFVLVLFDNDNDNDN